jgi:hypothetical protein
MHTLVEERSSGPYDFILRNSGVQGVALVEDKILVSFARETSDPRPPIVCLDASSGEFIWKARLTGVSSEHIGNCRFPPVVWQGLVLSTFAYDGNLYAFDLTTGLTKWVLALDVGFFQNWAAPVLAGEFLYVPRINGVISRVNLQRRTILTTVTVGITPAIASDAPNNPGYFAGSDEQAYPGQTVLSGLCSTPLALGDKLYAGSVTGELKKVSFG